MKSGVSHKSEYVIAFFSELTKACVAVKKAVPMHRTVEVSLFAEAYSPGFSFRSSAVPKGHRLGSNAARIVTFRQSTMRTNVLMVCYGGAHNFDADLPRYGHAKEYEFIASSPKVRRENAAMLAEYLARGTTKGLTI